MLWKYSDADYINYINNVTNKPPTVYFLLESIVNYGKDEKTKIKDLASEGRTRFFNFDYPLTNKIDKATFETNILNHFMMRRIGAETFTAFQINLNAKMNEIMPLYNMMFDSLDGIDLLNESYTRTGTDNSNTTNSIENTSNTTSDRRYSDTPQNRLSEIQSGEYVTEYNLDSNNDHSTSDGESENTRTYTETITKSPSNKIQHLKELQKEIKSIYSLIYEDLDDLFYGLI
jgi:hypothetical protein